MRPNDRARQGMCWNVFQTNKNSKNKWHCKRNKRACICLFFLLYGHSNGNKSSTNWGVNCNNKKKNLSLPLRRSGLWNVSCWLLYNMTRHVGIMRTNKNTNNQGLKLVPRKRWTRRGRTSLTIIIVSWWIYIYYQVCCDYRKMRNYSCDQGLASDSWDILCLNLHGWNVTNSKEKKWE